jgi:hypothetical protein
MPSREDSVRFDLPSGARIIEANTLESMKTALLSFLDGPDFPVSFLELLEPMRAELKASVGWVHGGEAGIGAWKLENRTGHLTLVHYPPPRKGTMYLYHARMEPQNTGWKVVSFEQERELGPD